MTDQQSRLSIAISDRYVVEREIGRGGMAIVYLAEDRKHQRQVAVKVLRPDVAAVCCEPERFLREIQIAARLTHPHILPLHDSGQTDGLLYYVMPYVAGESLRQRLEREKQLRIDDALRITEQIADALEYAHAEGVVHRDIKPENILFQAGHPLVADFGIARAVTVAGGEELTATGIAIGTPAYMSPEQASGEHDVDARSDVYALGCVLYEMLVGEAPFTGPTPQVVMAKRFADPVPSARRLREGVPQVMDAALKRALAKAPADRFASARAFAEALCTRPEPLGLQRTTLSPEDTAIVVLPFENLSPDPDNAYFADGLTEELIAELSGIRTLRVISRTTALKLKGSDKDVGTISRELNVRYVLEGSVRKAGSALRITAQLIDGTRDAHLWAERYSGTLDDVFDMQERLARRIVDQLKVSLSPEEDRRIAQRPINDLVAYDCYLRAKLEIPRFTRDAVDRAVALLNKALAIEGPNELLFATLGIAHLSYLAPLPLREDESSLDAADAYAAKVFELNPDSGVGHALRGRTAFMKGNIEDAARHAKEACRLDPNNGDALWDLLVTSVWAGHPDAARRYLELLTAVDPGSGANPAWIEFYSGLFEAAVDGYRKEYEVDPDSPYTRWAYATVLAWAGQVSDACAIFEHIERDTPQTVFGWFATVISRALKGSVEAALRAITPELLAAARPHWQLRWMMAPLYAMVGCDEEALDWLELAVKRGFVNCPFLKREPFLKRLHSHPRFIAIVDEAKRRSETFEP